MIRQTQQQRIATLERENNRHIRALEALTQLLAKNAEVLQSLDLRIRVLEGKPA